MLEPALQNTIKAMLYPSEGVYVAECVGISVVTQGATVEEALRNLQEAVSLFLDGEDPREFGLAPDPTIVIAA